MTDISHKPNEPNWDESIAETPRFKERLPAVFEQLARAINDRASDPAMTNPRPVTRAKTTQRRTGIWRMFAWSTAMAMVMSLLSLLLLHSLVEERVRRDIETQNAAAKEEIAQMERDARERLSDWVNGEGHILTKTATEFQDLMMKGNLPLASIALYRSAYGVQMDESTAEALEQYQIDVEQFADLEAALLQVEIPPDFTLEDYNLLMQAVRTELGSRSGDS